MWRHFTLSIIIVSDDKKLGATLLYATLYRNVVVDKMLQTFAKLSLYRCTCCLYILALKFYFIQFILQWPWMSVERHEGFVWMQYCFHRWNCHLHFSRCAVFLATWTYIVHIVITAAPGEVQSIAISMSVCLVCPLTYIKTSQKFPYVLRVAARLWYSHIYAEKGR